MSEGQPALTPVEESTIRTLAESNCHIRPAAVLKVLDALAREREATEELRRSLLATADLGIQERELWEGRVRDLQEALEEISSPRTASFVIAKKIAREALVGLPE